MFSVDRWIGIAGLFVGIPGFILVFATQDKAVGWLVVLLALVVIGSIYLIHRAGKLPPFRMKSVNVDLRLLDALGNEATLRKEYEVVPSYAHLTEMSHRNIAADGAITNLKWNDLDLDPTWVKTVLGEYQITARFPGPLEKGKAFRCTLSYTCLGSFLQSQEALVYVVDFPAKLVKITVRFPDGRMGRDFRCYRVQGAGKVPLNSCAVDANGKTATLTLKRPPIGAEIEVWWNW